MGSPSSKPYVLELTEREVRVLRALLRHVGGDPKGPRGDAIKIANKLRDLGFLPEDDLIDGKYPHQISLVRSWDGHKRRNRWSVWDFSTR